MQKKLLVATLVLAIATPVVAHAQAGAAQPTEGVRFGVGAGLTLPMGDYSKVNSLGFHGLGLIQLPLQHSPVHLRFDVMFSHTGGKSGVGSANLIGGTFDALYHFGDHHASARPYILGGIGLYNSKFSGGTSSTNFAFGLGGGVLFGIGATGHAFAEARYMSVQTSGSSLTFIPITVGLMFNGN